MVSKYHSPLKECLGFPEKVIDSKNGVGMVQDDPKSPCISRKQGTSKPNQTKPNQNKTKEEDMSKKHRSLSEVQSGKAKIICVTK